jgi:hypothetical protein
MTDAIVVYRNGASGQWAPMSSERARLPIIDSPKLRCSPIFGPVCSEGIRMSHAGVGLGAGEMVTDD